MPCRLCLLAATLVALLPACEDPESDADADSDVDADADADVDADVDADADGPERYTTLANETPCGGGTGVIRADPGEEGHLVAVRLTPETTPFTVTKVRYRLPATPAPCSPTLAHRVELYVSEEVAPPATPTPVATIDVPADPGRASAPLVTHDLDAPLVLEAGQHLFVAVSMAGTSEERLCVTGCDNLEAEADRNYWSNAAAPPYTWATLASFGMQVNAEIWALGPAD
jgi:hypothetical protein